MSLDLDAIRERALPMRDGFYHVVGYYRAFRREDFDSLLAEVERLRGEVSYLRACVPPTRPTDYGHEVWTAALRAEVAAERAAVVAWLDAQLPDIDFCEGCGQRGTTVDRIADCIERGEHRREEDKG
jgi:hypothetical protein